MLNNPLYVDANRNIVTATIDAANNGSGNTGNTVYFQAINVGNSRFAAGPTQINFAATNGYLQSYGTMNCTNVLCGPVTLNPTSTTV